MNIGKVIQKITLLIGFLNILLPVLFWQKIPEQIPSHYNAEGIADHYSDKSSLVLILFVVLILMGTMGIAIYYVKQEMKSKYAKEADVSQMNIAYKILVSMNFVIQCTFAYITFCSASGKMLGKAFMPIVIAAVFCPLAFILIQNMRYDKKNYAQKSKLLQIEQLESGVQYRSKVDWWLGLLLIGTVVFMLYLSFEPLFSGNSLELSTITISLALVLLILPLFSVKYVFYSTHLLVSCGIYGKERIEYSAIRQMKETKNPLSSAALSLDRLQIDYMQNGYHQTVLISPVHKKEFMEKLEQYRKEGMRKL